MSKSVIISEGYSQIYLVPGIFILVVSIPFLIFNWPVGIILVAIAIILFLFKSGLEILPDKKACRGYKEIFGIRFGSWKNLNGYDFATIKYTHDRDKDNIYRVTEAGSMFQAVAFDLYVKTLVKELHLYEFTSYKLSRQALEILVNQMGFQHEDPIEISRNKVRKKYKDFHS